MALSSRVIQWCTCFVILFGVTAVWSAPERVGPQQNRPSRFTPYSRPNGGPAANTSRQAPRSSGNPWQSTQRPHAPQRASTLGPRGRAPAGNDSQSAGRPSGGWGGGACSNDSNSRRVTSAPLQQPPAGMGAPARRSCNPESRLPRPNAFARDLTQAREQQNVEARRVVAANTWQAFMRNRIVTLGYYLAGDVWLRSNTFRAGHFSRQEAEEHEEYARWCRDTILGLVTQLSRRCSETCPPPTSKPVIGLSKHDCSTASGTRSGTDTNHMRSHRSGQAGLTPSDLVSSHGCHERPDLDRRSRRAALRHQPPTTGLHARW